LRDIEGAFAAIAGLNSIRTLVDQIRDIALSFDEWAFSVGTVSAGVGTLVSTAITGLGAVLSIAADTLQVFQGIAAAPALMLSGATVLQTWTAIWQDFEAALQGIPGVLEEMPPAAQGAVGAVEDLNEAVNQAVQQRFWGQMTDEVERFTEAIGPHIVAAMGETSRVLGRVISNMLDYTEILADGGSLDVFTRNHTNAMELMGDAGERVFRALMNMGIQGSHYLPILGRAIDDLAIRFEAFINDALVTGKFDLWIINSINSLRSLGQAIGATWDIFAGFTRAFQDIGGPGLHEMADGLERIADWVNSSGVQQALRDIYQDAIDGASAAGQGFADLTQTAWDYRDALGDVLVVTGELAGAFMSSLGAINFDVAFRGFFDLMDGLEDFVRRAQPAFESISNIFGRLGSIGGEVAREVAHGMNLTMGAIDGFIARIEGPLIDAIHPLTRVFEDIAALGTGPLHAMADSLAVILDLFSALPAPIQNVITLLTVLGRTGILTGFQRGMQNLTRGLGATQQSVFRFTSNVENRTTRMRDRVANNMAAMGTSIRNVFVGSNVTGQVNRVAGQVESRFERMRSRVATTMGRVRGALGRAFGGLAGALGGPWGIALTTGIGVLSSFAGASAEAEAAQDRLKESVDAVTGAVEDQTVVDAYDQLTAKSDGFMDKVNNWHAELQGNSNDLEDIFSRMGTSAGELAQGLQGPAESVQEIADAARELNDLDSAFSFTSPWGDLQKGDFSGVSDGARQLYENLNLSELSAHEAKIAIEAIAGVYGPVADAAEHAANRTADVGDAAYGAAGDVENMASAADGMPPMIEAVADMMATVADETANADQRSQALHQTLKMLNGEELSADELLRGAVDAFDNTMSQVERIANDTEFDWSNVFTEDGSIDYTVEGNQIKGMVDDFQASFSDRLAANRIKLEDEGIDYSQDDFDKFVAGLEEEWSSLGDTLVEELGLTGQAAEQFRAMWDENMIFDPVDIELAFDGENNAERAKEQFETLQDLGLEIDQSEWLASLDVDDNNAIDSIEYAQGMVETFDGLYAEAKAELDEGRMQEIIDAAWEFGFAWDGENFHAVIDADGEPNQEAFEAAWEAGRVWHDGSFVTEVDADTDPATDALVDTINQADGLWVNGEYVAKLEADGNPSEEVIEYARSLGLEWNGSKFVATVDSDGDGAIAEVTKAREQHQQFEGVYQALLDANYLPSAAEAIATAIAESEEFEGDYVAFLKALQTEEGRQNLIEFIEGVEGIPDETKSEIIASIENKELLEDFQDDLNDITERDTEAKVSADTSEAEDKIDGVSNHLREYSTIEPSTTVDADTEDADNKIENTAGAAQNLGLINPLISLGIMGDNHVINQVGEVEGAVGKVDGNFISTLLSVGGPAVVTAALSAFDADSLVDDSFLSTLLTSGSPSVVTAAMAAFGADKLVDDSFLSTLLSTGSGGVIAAAMGAFGASNLVDDIFTAIFGETGAGHVQNQAGNVQGSISSINMNPIVTFGATILGSFWTRISQVKNAISGVWSSLTGGGSADGSMTGTRYKQQPVTLFTAKAFASGGFENHTAQIAYSKPSTPIRIWAEPETGGEAYIPLSPAKRQRSMGIFEEVGKEFGVFGDGGIAGGVVTRTEQEVAGGDVYNIRIEGSDVTVKDLMNEVTHQRRRSGRR